MTPEQKKWIDDMNGTVRWFAGIDGTHRREREFVDYKEDTVGLGVFFIVRTGGRGNRKPDHDTGYEEIYKSYPWELLPPHKRVRKPDRAVDAS